jgi:Rad3-related DNA helicase
VHEPHRRRLPILTALRQAAQSAHMVIVNHSLLLSDVITGNRFVPDYSYLIIDEGTPSRISQYQRPEFQDHAKRSFQAAERNRGQFERYFRASAQPGKRPA